MSKNLKKWMAGEVRSSLGGADACVVLGFRRLSGEDSSALRGHLRKSSVELTVVRNRVAAHAVAGTALEGIVPFMKGPTAVATGGEDAVSLAKAVVEGVKGREGFDFRGGLVEGRVVTGEEVKHLATLPSRPELLALIAATVVQPITDVALGVDAILTELARTVEALREKVEKEAAA